MYVDRFLYVNKRTVQYYDCQSTQYFTKIPLQNLAIYRNYQMSVVDVSTRITTVLSLLYHFLQLLHQDLCIYVVLSIVHTIVTYTYACIVLYFRRIYFIQRVSKDYAHSCFCYQKICVMNLCILICTNNKNNLTCRLRDKG